MKSDPGVNSDLLGLKGILIKRNGEILGRRFLRKTMTKFQFFDAGMCFKDPLSFSESH